MYIRLLDSKLVLIGICVFVFFLKSIQECEDPSSLLRPMDTEHLVLRTRMHVMEFKLLLDNCPNLETLTFDIIRRSKFSVRLYLYSIEYRLIVTLLCMIFF